VIRKNKKFIDPRYFMNEKMESPQLKEDYDTPDQSNVVRTIQLALLRQITHDAQEEDASWIFEQDDVDLDPILGEELLKYVKRVNNTFEKLVGWEMIDEDLVTRAMEDANRELEMLNIPPEYLTQKQKEILSNLKQED
jgi:hypothetical protein